MDFYGYIITYYKVCIHEIKQSCTYAGTLSYVSLLEALFESVRDGYYQWARLFLACASKHAVYIISGRFPLKMIPMMYVTLCFYV